MGLRFRSRVRIFPGVHLNAGLKSMSVSLGGLTIGTRGTRATMPLGAGLSYTTYSPWRRRRPFLATPPGLTTDRRALRIAYAVLQGLYVAATLALRIALAVGMVVGVLLLACVGAALETGRRRRR